MDMKCLLLCLSILLLVGCNKTKKQNYESISELEMPQNIQEHPGKKLMKVYCYVCHDASTPEDKRVAPPMIAVKRHYLMENSTKTEFIADMQDWIKTPTEEKAKMYGAIERFGVMSKMAYPESVIEKIADYMYDNELEKPEWFEAHYNKRRFDNNRNN